MHSILQSIQTRASQFCDHLEAYLKIDNGKNKCSCKFPTGLILLRSVSSIWVKVMEAWNHLHSVKVRQFHFYFGPWGPWNRWMKNFDSYTTLYKVRAEFFTSLNRILGTNTSTPSPLHYVFNKLRWVLRNERSRVIRNEEYPQETSKYLLT